MMDEQYYMSKLSDLMYSPWEVIDEYVNVDVETEYAEIAEDELNEIMNVDFIYSHMMVSGRITFEESLL